MSGLFIIVGQRRLFSAKKMDVAPPTLVLASYVIKLRHEVSA
jgi:hypothetical protein